MHTPRSELTGMFSLKIIRCDCLPPVGGIVALQEAATRSEAAVSLEALRRSCSWTDAASRETPRETPAATRVTRTWRTVMTA